MKWYRYVTTLKWHHQSMQMNFIFAIFVIFIIIIISITHVSIKIYINSYHFVIFKLSLFIKLLIDDGTIKKI